MSAAIGPPDQLTIWPLDGHGFGIDARWSGGDGNRRATVVRRLLEGAAVPARLSQHPDGRGWELRIGTSGPNVLSEATRGPNGWEGKAGLE